MQIVHKWYKSLNKHHHEQTLSYTGLHVNVCIKPTHAHDYITCHTYYYDPL